MGLEMSDSLGRALRALELSGALGKRLGSFSRRADLLPSSIQSVRVLVSSLSDCLPTCLCGSLSLCA